MMPTLRCIERAVTGKDARLPCEDAIFFDGRFAAVVDGATAKAPHEPGRPTPGEAIVGVVVEALASLRAEVTGSEAVGYLSQAVAAWLASAAVPFGEPPSASVAILSAARSEAWLVGDCRLSIAGNPIPTDKAVDGAAAAFRSAVLAAEIAAGRTVEDLLADDTGREAIRTLLVRQAALRNAPPGTPYAYGAIDGNPAAGRYLRTLVVPAACEVVLATDGYPDPGDTLAEAEAGLARVLEWDPLMMALHPSTKGVAPGARSFDDRAYLRIGVGPG